MNSRLHGRLSWGLLALVLAGALVVGSQPRHSGAPSVGERVHHIASQIRCPTCRSISADQSDAAASVAIRAEIRRRIAQGQSDGEILAFFLSRYGNDILLKPKASGLAGLLWVLPVVAVVCGLGGITLAFRRWRARRNVTVSAEDQALVATALETLDGPRQTTAGEARPATTEGRATLADGAAKTAADPTPS